MALQPKIFPLTVPNFMLLCTVETVAPNCTSIIFKFTYKLNLRISRVGACAQTPQMHGTLCVHYILQGTCLCTPLFHSAYGPARTVCFMTFATRARTTSTSCIVLRVPSGTMVQYKLCMAWMIRCQDKPSRFQASPVVVILHTIATWPCSCVV